MLNELKRKLQAEVERLNHEISFVLPKEIEKALAHGDLRENSEYKAALERQQFAAARLTHLRLRLSKLSGVSRSEEHTSELQSQSNLVCRLLLEKKKKKIPSRVA